VSEGSVTRVETRPNLSRIIPPGIAEIFGNPPLLSLEDRQAYDQLLAQLALEWKPRSITEWMFVRDIADISWEILRHRRAIANLFAISFKAALGSVLTDVLPRGSHLYDKVQALKEDWFKGPQEQAKVKAELAKYGVSPEGIVAQTYALRGDELDKLHRLLAVAEARRTAITRNFNEYRAMSSLSEKPVIDSDGITLVPDST
jgi:hypothetical protein